VWARSYSVPRPPRTLARHCRARRAPPGRRPGGHRRTVAAGFAEAIARLIAAERAVSPVPVLGVVGDGREPARVGLQAGQEGFNLRRGAPEGRKRAWPAYYEKNAESPLWQALVNLAQVITSSEPSDLGGIGPTEFPSF